MESQALNFKISTCLRKPMALPSADKFHIHNEDLLVADKVLCCTKARGLIFDHVSPLEERSVSLTRHGYLVVYMGTTKGFILDICRAESVFTVTDSFKKRRMPHRRCHLKIKFSFGSFNIFLLDDKISVWRRHIGNAFDGCIPEAKQTCTQSLDDTLGSHIDTEDMFLAKGVKKTTSSNSIPSILRSDTQMSVIDDNETDKNTLSMDTDDSRVGTFVTVAEGRPQKNRNGSSGNVEKSTRTKSCKKMDEKMFDQLLADFDKMAPVPEQQSIKKQECVPVESRGIVDRNISMKSVRCGTVPVATLRKRLETKVLKRATEKLEEKAQIETHESGPCPRYGKPLMCPDAACQPKNFARAIGLSKSSPSISYVSNAVSPCPNQVMMNGKFGIKAMAAKFDVLKNEKPFSPSYKGNVNSAFGRFSLAQTSTSRCESHA